MDETLPVFAADVDWDEAQSALEARELGDGLPMVPPTRARLDAMLACVSKRDQLLGTVAPLYGELTPAAVAYQCVLAGCLPGHLPIVVTALEACLDEAFNLLGIATTTGTPAVAVVVHGPVVDRLGVNASTNCLGPGNRANASIGRAVSFGLRNIGGARAGIGDMATMGQPGKYGLCFAENRDHAGDPRFPTLAERRGLRPDDDAVTVLGVSGTAEVLPVLQDTPESILTPVAAAMWAASVAAGGARDRGPSEQAVAIPPELVEGVLKRGWTLAAVQEFLARARPLRFDEKVAPWAKMNSRPLASSPDDIHVIVTGGPGVKMTHLPLWAGGTRPITRPLRQL